MGTKNISLPEALTRDLGLPGLRCWPVTPFPHRVFYREEAEQVEVWRVLHGHRDVPSTRTSALP